MSCKLSSPDGECLKFEIICRGTEDDKDECPLWSIRNQIDGFRTDLYGYWKQYKYWVENGSTGT